jgi:hypothetical protein
MSFLNKTSTLAGIVCMFITNALGKWTKFGYGCRQFEWAVPHLPEFECVMKRASGIRDEISTNAVPDYARIII